MAIKVGNKAPAFSLPTYGGDKVRLKDFEGQYLVVYFYPKDMTPGCTTEAQNFRDSAKALKKLGAAVVGVSKDSVERHEKFRDKHELNFPLLSDESGKMLEKYDAWGEKKMYGKTFMGIIRSTVVVGPDGRVVAHFPKVRVKGHVDAVVDAINEHRAA
ncbi:MAG: thioredoxin-dependent thiol peroxidase [Myxococcota bacterium]